jgi:hypothetical protein
MRHPDRILADLRLRLTGLADTDPAGRGDRVFAVALHLAGFTCPPQPVSYWTILLHPFRATLSLTDSEVELTAWASCNRACYASPARCCST